MNDGMRESVRSKTPFHLIVGPLVVGKTSGVLDYQESQADAENTAVIVNDFGKAGLDLENLEAMGLSSSSPNEVFMRLPSLYFG